MDKKIRAVNDPGKDIGKKRYIFYRQAFGHIAKSMEQGFNLEAISVIENLISDRLEGHLTYLLGANYSFKTLGDLIYKTKEIETDEILKELIAQDLNQWRIKRNASIHEMVKFEEGDTNNWFGRIKDLPAIAEEGLYIYRKIDKRIGIIKKEEKLAAMSNSKLSNIDKSNEKKLNN